MVQIDNWSKSRHYYQNIFFKKSLKIDKNIKKQPKTSQNGLKTAINDKIEYFDFT